ncbi:MAG: hypothetical protein Q7T86_03345 [Hyphomicrobiaceae bacterium]|nr:hypothetical protein [Hyphomicrobiaceae bacterium]
MKHIIERLEDVRCDRQPFTPDHAKCICRLTNEAAKDIAEREETIRSLREALEPFAKAHNNYGALDALRPRDYERARAALERFKSPALLEKDDPPPRSPYACVAAAVALMDEAGTHTVPDYPSLMGSWRAADSRLRDLKGCMERYGLCPALPAEGGE